MHIKDTFPELYQLRRPLKPEEARARLREKRGREFWQSLEELAAGPEFEEMLHREFPQQATGWGEGTDRRTFLKLMGASLALAGLSGCSYQPPEAIVPYVSQPEEIVPGKPLFFATAMPFAGGATPLLARSNEGRPTKLEGNDLHPASMGAADVFAQAAILSLYDPDRSETIVNRGEVRTYTAFLAEVSTLLEGQRPRQGAGLRFLTETITSPTLAAQMRDILRRFPGARWHQWEPGGAGTNAAATMSAFGAPATPLYRFAEADRVLSLDSNFLECGPGALRYARDFASRRRVRDGETREPSRLYAVETTPTNTGVFADHRLPVRPSEFDAVVSAIASGLGVGPAGPQLAGEAGRFVAAVVEDLRAHAGRSIVIAGDEQPPRVQALAHALNAALGNNGKTVTYVDPVEENPVDQLEDLRRLVADIDAGAVEVLVVVGGNPVYTAPADLSLRERLLKVPMTVHLSLYNDETSELCHWHIPEAHFLESWGDARAFDGTVTLVQPLVQPLYNGKSAHEFLAAFSEQPERTGYQLIREYWMTPGAGQTVAPVQTGGGAQPANTPPPP
ncbi:MAG TPA: TAT-variant-translocated molybdopterin oxidoreductase, partial [Pyrinomonadaceae bacterium]|nr:TAT-variant-translocated molybdopterin oxidoreductase [Pyrinomonadaceae bacterium]